MPRETARTADDGDRIAPGSEDLDPVVTLVGDENTTVRTYRYLKETLESARIRTELAPVVGLVPHRVENDDPFLTGIHNDQTSIRFQGQA